MPKQIRTKRQRCSPMLEKTLFVAIVRTLNVIGRNPPEAVTGQDHWYNFMVCSFRTVYGHARSRCRWSRGRHMEHKVSA